VTRTTLFLWGMLLVVAPCATAFVVWQRIDHDVWATASGAGLAAAAVVCLFGFSVSRVPAYRSRPRR
jgi:hypothetical protein